MCVRLHIHEVDLVDSWTCSLTIHCSTTSAFSEAALSNMCMCVRLHIHEVDLVHSWTCSLTHTLFDNVCLLRGSVVEHVYVCQTAHPRSGLSRFVDLCSLTHTLTTSAFSEGRRLSNMCVVRLHKSTNRLSPLRGLVQSDHTHMTSAALRADACQCMVSAIHDCTSR